MGLEKEFGLFKQSKRPLISPNGLISGKPKRSLTKPFKKLGGFFAKPFKQEVKRRFRKKARKKVKQLFEKPKRFTTEDILEMERKDILKKLRKKKQATREMKEIKSLEKKFGGM